MMKKLLVLALVLAVAGLANAGLSLNGAAKALEVSSSDNLAYVANLVFVLPTDATSIALTTAGNQNLSFLTDYGVMAGADLGLTAASVHLFSFSAASSVANALQPGIHLAAVTNAVVASQGTVAAVYLMSEDFSTVLGTLYAPVPEPITMVLLGLGGLFLRRK